MRITTYIFTAYLFICASGVFADQTSKDLGVNTETGNIHLSIENLPKTSTGLIVSIYRSQDNFLKKAEEVYYFPVPEDGKLILKNIAYGNFAIALVADQNANQKLDTKIFGIPNEPVGFANNPKSKFGPPSFKQSFITHNKSEQKFTIVLVDI